MVILHIGAIWYTSYSKKNMLTLTRKHRYNIFSQTKQLFEFLNKESDAIYKPVNKVAT